MVDVIAPALLANFTQVVKPVGRMSEASSAIS
ncbi:hypothetical protein BJ122_11314 [Rhodopseudomonas faecalis]|uniref:Uncharacterized protein n=1 Tax=Rhodopseudomonas faecalis TaxID=99655 RepID=A0A318TEE7_9BRAD|nr:hypothetical protein BJ122_11314 [Rhodopseudomonas faecalis]